MKKKFTLVLSALMISGLAWDYSHQSAVSSSNSAPAGRTGSPGDGVSCFSSCHGNQPGTATNNEAVELTGMPATYTPGTTYDLTLTATHAPTSKFGFQLAVQDDNGGALGTLASGTGSTLVGAGSAWLTHSPSSTMSGSQSWDFQWTAPDAGTGTVGVHYAVLFADGDFSNSGDVMVSESQYFDEATVGISEADLAALAVYPNPVADEIHIAAKDVDEEIMVTLFNVEGKKVLEERFEGGEININVASKNLNTGVYFLNLEVDGKSTIKKLLVK